MAHRALTGCTPPGQGMKHNAKTDGLPSVPQTDSSNGRDQGVRSLRSEAYISTPQRREVKHNADIRVFDESVTGCRSRWIRRSPDTPR